uniref:Cysteine-rich protein 1 n=1 Tax=Sphaeramia orbicularis TaxID=375764 RepID=A0A673CQA5_9TELE
MPKCPKCQKEVYFAERVTSLGKDWHRPCLKCEKCSKTLSPGSHAEVRYQSAQRLCSTLVIIIIIFICRLESPFKNKQTNKQTINKQNTFKNTDKTSSIFLKTIVPVSPQG